MAEPGGAETRLAERVAELGESVAELRLRIDQLESAALDGPAVRTPDTDGAQVQDSFWALSTLRGLLPAGHGAVMFAGIVPMPNGEEYVWQYGQLTRTLLATDWPQLSSAIAALGNPVRLRLLHLILAGTHTAAALQAGEGLGTSGQIYHHLRQLTAAGWLQQTSRAQYQIPPARIIPLLVMLAAAQ